MITYVDAPARLREISGTEIKTIDPAERNAAELALHHCSRDLGIMVLLKIRWFQPMTPADEAVERKLGRRPWHTTDLTGNTAGYIASNSAYDLWVRADMGWRQVLATVAHECRHHYQWRAWGRLTDDGGYAMPACLDTDTREKDASTYERMVRLDLEGLYLGTRSTFTPAG